MGRVSATSSTVSSSAVSPQDPASVLPSPSYPYPVLTKCTSDPSICSPSLSGPTPSPLSPSPSRSTLSPSLSSLSLFDLKSNDPKLVHIIQKIISSPAPLTARRKKGATSTAADPLPTSERVVELVLARHREYRRKNGAALRNCVGGVLDCFHRQRQQQQQQQKRPGSSVRGRRKGPAVPIGRSGAAGGTAPAGCGTGTSQTTGHPSGPQSGIISQRHLADNTAIEEDGTEDNNIDNESNSSPPNKRRRPKTPTQQHKQQQQHNQQHNQQQQSDLDEEEGSYDSYEEEARLHDHQRRALLTTPEYDGITSTMLNANLQNRYKSQQRQRDVINRKKKAVEEREERRAKEKETMRKLEKAMEDVARLKREAVENRATDGIVDGDKGVVVVADDQEDDTERHNNEPRATDKSSTTTNGTKTVTVSRDKPPTTTKTPTAEPRPPTNIRKLSPASPNPKKKKKKKKARPSSPQPGGSSTASNTNNTNGDDDGDTSTVADAVPRPKERYTDLGGLSSTLTQIRELVEYPLSHPELFTHLGIHPPRGVLLRGPPGCGKTHLANAIAGQLAVTYYRISAPEIVSGMSGESESRIRKLFATASRNAPALIFVDEIDAIAPKRGGDGGKGMEKRIVAQLLTCMDSLAPENNRGGRCVMVLGATNRPDSLDSALRRAGRFDREICLGVPDEKGREGILRVMTKQMRLSGDIDFKVLAKKTPGFVGADVRSLTKEAGVIAINRIFKNTLIYGGDCDGGGGGGKGDNQSTSTSTSSLQKDDANTTANATVPTNPVDHDATMTDGDDTIMKDPSTTNDGSDNATDNHSMAQDVNSVTPLSPMQLEPLYVTMDDFLAALPNVQPSSKREGFATVPDVSWENIGALTSIREELTLSVLEPITHPEKFHALGLPLPAGVLLYGPPGCGKTLLAKAIANESGANFISVKGPELLDKYVGESERAVRTVFERARSSSPCIVFFDELDSLCPKRGGDSGGGGVSERVVNQLLTEMDGLDSRNSVFVIAATNRPELIDPAMLRPGRLDKLLYVPLPSPEDRVGILKALAVKVKLAPDVDLEAIATSSRADGYSGADCAALLREAGLAVLRDSSLLLGSRSVGRGTLPTAPARDVQETDGTSEKTKIVPPPFQVTLSHFDYAFDHVMPSVSKRDQAKYDKVRNRMARARARGGVTEKQPGDTQSSSGENCSGGKENNNDT